MKLQTQIQVNKQKHNNIDYDSRLLLLGSCFSENIYQKLDTFKFKAFSNPFGIQFHVLGIEKLITRAINEDFYKAEELLNYNGLFFSYDAHSSLSSDSAEHLLNRLNEGLSTTFEWITSASHIIITLGTSWVYRHVSSDRIVSNCHKVPQRQFSKELLPVNSISESLEATIKLIKSVNPKVVFVFTVSPVRHIKDGFAENTRSKAHLHTAIHQVVEDNDKSYYFPSYEIQMDELRDYRFYKEDMLHPNDLAISIIWHYFVQSWFSEEALTLMPKVEDIQKRLLHRPLHPNTEQHHQFVLKLKKDMESLKAEYPHISF